jgi:hypothetical protein
MRGGGVLAAAVFSLGLAVIITAATLPKRQTPAVINSLSSGAVKITEASLGQAPGA